MSSRSLVIWLVLALAPMGIVASRVLVPAGTLGHETPSQRVVAQGADQAQGVAYSEGPRPFGR